MVRCRDRLTPPEHVSQACPLQLWSYHSLNHTSREKKLPWTSLSYQWLCLGIILKYLHSVFLKINLFTYESNITYVDMIIIQRCTICKHNVLREYCNSRLW